MTGTSAGATGTPLTAPANRANAVVDVAWEDGKLSEEGVPTPTSTVGCSGRRRRTTRLMTTEVACAPKLPTPTIAHRLRRAGSATTPTAEIAIQPSACSRTCESVTAAYAAAQEAQINVQTEQAKLEAAKVSAQQKVVQAQAEADANAILNASLTDAILQQRYLDTLKELAASGNLVVVPEGFNGLVNVGR